MGHGYCSLGDIFAVRWKGNRGAYEVIKIDMHRCVYIYMCVFVWMFGDF